MFPGIFLLRTILQRLPNLRTLHSCVYEEISAPGQAICERDIRTKLHGGYEMYTLLTNAQEAGLDICNFSMCGYREPRPFFRTDIWAALSSACSNLISVNLAISLAISRNERDLIPANVQYRIPGDFPRVYSELSTSQIAASFKAFLYTLANLQVLKLNFEATE